jgi:hypothetical protein
MKIDDCRDYEILLAGALAGEISAAERRGLDEHLAVCPRCAAEAASLGEIWRGLGRLEAEAPSPFLAARFERMLAREIAAEATRESLAAAAPRRSPVLAWAAGLAAALAMGVALGFFAAGGGGARREVAELRGEVAALHETVAVSMLGQASPSERLQGVAYSRPLAASDPRVREALLAALARDSNVNVRLAALEALAPATALPHGRARLLAAVAAQDSPLVQLSAIDLLLEHDGAAARRDLEQLLADPDLDPTVASYLRDRLGRSA